MDQSLTTDLQLQLQNSTTTHAAKREPEFLLKVGVLWFRRIWIIFAHMFIFAVVGFSKCKSLYLNEREKCYGRQIYAFNPHR
jgi:hypothetical protein